MKVCVVSDTHGKIDQVVAHILKSDYDQIWHLGDYVTDAEAIQSKTGLKTIYVKGNCDATHEVDAIQLINCEKKRIFWFMVIIMG